MSTFFNPASTPNPGGVDPLWVLWKALGSPEPARVPLNKTGRCARCNAYSETAARVKHVISDKFTGWDEYTSDHDPLWCIPCAWAHTESEVRTRPWIIAGSRVVEADSATLASELESSLDQYVSVVVPISRHKHILPGATWGTVTTDDRVLPWEGVESGRFRTVQWLRSLGFSEAALAAPSPRFEQMAKLNAGKMNLVLSRWNELNAWRKDPAYLQVACIASRTSKQASA